VLRRTRLRILPAAALAALSLIGCDGGETGEDMGLALVDTWTATLVRGEVFPEETTVEIGGVVQGPQTRTRTLYLYEGGGGELVLETRFVSLLSKVENISRSIYKARVTADQEPEFTLRLTRERDLILLDCALDDITLTCVERDDDDDANTSTGTDPVYKTWVFTS
jgi:hypothetical protein